MMAISTALIKQLPSEWGYKLQKIQEGLPYGSCKEPGMLHVRKWPGAEEMACLLFVLCSTMGYFQTVVRKIKDKKVL